MTRTISHFLLAGATVLSIGASAQTSSHASKKGFALKTSQTSKKAARMAQNQISLPGTSQDYFPDGNGGWSHVKTSTYTYDTFGRLLQRVEINPANGDSLNKYTYAFDAHGNDTEQFRYSWQNNQWVLDDYSSKTTYTYNAANQVTEEVDQYWSSATMSFVNTYKSTSEYNSNGNIERETYYGWNNNAWEVEESQLFIYTSPSLPPAEIVFQDMVNGNFVDDWRYTNITWHNFADFKPLTYTGEEWDGTAWVLSERGTVSYDANGGSIETLEVYQNGNWVNSERWTETYNNHNHETGMKSENWNGTAWELDWEEVVLLTYNANQDLTERIYRDSNSMSGALEDRWREVYSDFQYVMAAPALVAELGISLYPNPVQNQLSVSGVITEASTVTITDLTGRTVYQQKLQPSETIINATSLTPGTYIVQVSNSKGSKTSKIVKL